MAKHNEIGKIGESIAVAFLEDKGYRILECNWSYGKAELDLIATKTDVLIFVEVKTREHRRFGYPEDSVTSKKEKLMYKAAVEYMAQIKYEEEIRFDIISIILEPDLEICHFEDAFFPGWDI